MKNQSKKINQKLRLNKLRIAEISNSQKRFILGGKAADGSFTIFTNHNGKG